MYEGGLRGVRSPVIKAIKNAFQELGFKDEVVKIDCWVTFHGWPRSFLINYPTRSAARKRRSFAATPKRGNGNA